MKLLTIMAMGLFLLSFSSAYECQDNMEFWNSPCEVVTPVFDITGGCNASVLNINNTDMNYTIGLTGVGDGTNNFTFDYTDVATYSITVSCNNYSSTINLNMGTEEDEPGFNLWVVLFIIFFILILTGVYKRNYILIFVSGCLSLLMGIYIFEDGITIYSVESWWIYPLAWIFTGIGIMVSIASSIKIMAEAEGKDNTYEYEAYEYEGVGSAGHLFQEKGGGFI